MALPKPERRPIALGVVAVSADDDVARIAQHRNDMQVPVDQKPWADDMEVNGVLGEIDADVLFVPAQRGFMGLEGIDGKTTDHAFGKQSRSGARAGSDDVNSFHPDRSQGCQTVKPETQAPSAAPAYTRLPRQRARRHAP